jgi:hypothetical protein
MEPWKERQEGANENANGKSWTAASTQGIPEERHVIHAKVEERRLSH